MPIKAYVKYKKLFKMWCYCTDDFQEIQAKKPNQQKITCITYFNMSYSFPLQLGGCLTQMPRNELQYVLYL